MVYPQDTNYEKLIDRFLDQIMRGELRKGEKLPTERQLAEKMNVSRTSIREALKALEALGIAYSIQGSGTYITDQPENTINKALCALFALSDGTLDNILQLRILLETEACKDIIRYADNREIEKLVALANYDYSTPASEQAIRDEKFHAAIVAMSHNAMVIYLYTTLSSLMSIYRNRVLEATYRIDENDLTRLGHFSICRALQDRDEKAAAAAIREHLDLNDIYRWSLENDFGTPDADQKSANDL